MKFSWRFNLLQLFIFAALSFLTFSLFYTQVLRGGHFRKIGEHNRIRIIRLEAPRGNIYDRAGVLLATTRPAYNVYIIPEDFDPQDLRELSSLLDLTQDVLRHRISKVRGALFTPVLLQQDVSKELAMQIEERRPKLRGVFIHVQAIRAYPQGENAAHLVGYIGKISSGEYEHADRSVYSRDSWMGRSGLEKIYDTYLRGEDGGRQIEVDARGIPVRLLGERQPVRGKDLHLTIDSKFEAQIRPIFADKRASAMMMDIQTGEIVAAVSTPGFDPNVFVSAGRSRERVELLGSEAKPLLNRGFNGLYPPGSVFKLITAMAGLESGLITPNTTFNCPGYFKLGPRARPLKCWFHEGHGPVNLYRAVERSCNVYFCNVGRLVGEKRISEYARKLGFGESIPIGFPTASGLVPDAAWKKQKYHDQWYGGDTIAFAIGQSYLLVSPLQVLRLAAAIASDGMLIAPRVVREQTGKEENKKIAIKHETFEVLRKGMLQVVSSEKGTGQLARVEFMKLAAKTGTAQAPPGDAHAWFAGFFPYDNPRYALVIFVERGQSGGVTAAKFAKSITQIWHQMYASQIS